MNETDFGGKKVRFSEAVYLFYLRLKYYFADLADHHKIA